MLKNNLFITLLLPFSLYALGDYRCTEHSLCESCSIDNVDSFDKAVSAGELTGHLRLAYIHQNDDAPNTDATYATSIGGELKYETARYYNTSLALSTYVSQKVSPLSGDFNKGTLNLDFFNADGSSFAYLGEAYADYHNKGFDVRLGRQKLDTPLNDRDDIRMLPNTFEALTVGYGGIKDFVFVGGYIHRWAGFDSGDDISKFKDIPGDIAENGEHGSYVALLGVMNESFENIELQAWYYGFDKLTDVVYIDGVYEETYSNDTSASFGLQFADYSERDSSKVEGTVYGAMTSASYKPVTLTVAYNSVIDSRTEENIVIGYGGGPYFSSMEEMTIDKINDAQAYVASIDLEPLNGLVLSYAFGHFDGKVTAVDVEYEEHDVILTYQFYEKLDIEASYADIQDKKQSGADNAGYNRTLVRMNYNF